MNESGLFLPRRLTGTLVSVALAAALLAAGSTPPTREESARLRAKVDAITRNGDLPSPAPLVTHVSEREVNAYFIFDALPHLPAGFTEPRITIQPDLSLLGTATIDLDAVRQQRKSKGWFDPLNYLTGKVPVLVSGRLEARDGQARFALDTAKLSGVSIPKMLVQELLTFYTRTAANPRGIGLDDPYPLPSRIRQIVVRPGEALVTQ